MQSDARGRAKVRTVRLSNREIVLTNRPAGFWSDLHHHALTVGWPAFFAWAAATFLLFNIGFALLYSLGHEPIANIAQGNPLGLLYFSIETLATVGYGDMHPQTDYGHLVATVEIFTGMSLMAVMTGLVFTRFSRPQARFVFARHPVVSAHDGVSTLMVRIANARGNMIAGATAKLWLVRDEVSLEGGHLRRFHQLHLQRHENPVFMLSWTLLHPIDAASPLAETSAEDLERDNAALIVTVVGVDESTTQQLMARHTWNYDDLRWGHRYVDMLTRDEDGRVRLDHRRFHDVEPVGTVPAATKLTGIAR